MLIISASNVVTTKEKSQSLAFANEAKIALECYGKNVEVMDLRDYEIRNCNMCECCAIEEKCINQDGFNDFYTTWKKHDDILIICPHYASVPSKLVAIIEKLQEICYLAYCSGRKVDIRKRVVIVAHGGMTEDYVAIYKSNIISPLSNMLKGIGCKIVNEEIEMELCFGVKKYYDEKETNSVCFKKDNDNEKSKMVMNLAVKGIIGNSNK